MNKRNNRGFTLAELLIVVAIIAVLVAIAIPVFTQRLEQSRETTDLANLRSAYAAGTVAALAGEYSTQTGIEYKPDDPTGLVSSGGTTIGRGTATRGGADSTGLPDVISYAEDLNVKDQVIKVDFDSGLVSKVYFK